MTYSIIRLISNSLSNRRAWLAGLMLLLAACGSEAPTAQNAAAQNDPASEVQLAVYKSPTCGCCQLWIDHAEEAGFQATIHHPDDLMAEKLQRGILPQYHSCHTAVADDGSVFEGHIPAGLISQFLADKPADAIGLAVPGMPIGSPGMEVGTQFSPYDVLLIKADGSSSVYHRVESLEEQY